MLEDVKVGDRVKSCLAGWGTVRSDPAASVIVEEIGPEFPYPIFVKFDCGKIDHFTLEGRSCVKDPYPEIVSVIFYTGVQKKEMGTPRQVTGA